MDKLTSHEKAMALLRQMVLVRIFPDLVPEARLKWIEELIGRRISLEADSVIAVSSSGFTSGAIKKANKYGVVLKDLITLTEDDILGWTKGINIHLLFFRYSEFYLTLMFNDEDLDGLCIDNLHLVRMSSCRPSSVG